MFHNALYDFLPAQLAGGTGTRRSEQFGHDHLDALLMGQFNLFGGHPSKVVDKVGGLFFVPPSERFNLKPKGLQGRLSTFDLDLVAAVSQRERHRAVNEDFHWPEKNGRKGN
ncbi:MAG: hypothetical protein ACLP2Y_08445 [Limisphaerales bacterium]